MKLNRPKPPVFSSLLAVQHQAHCH